jgi:ATP-dependent exoDNAse (exonuclease V) alpha subunit
MAIYHCEVKPMSRSKGRSSTAGAAYRSCSKVYDERTAELHDYSRKRGLEYSEIVLSTKAAEQDIQWARDRGRLWNAAEASEVRKDARVAREYEVALPHELSKEKRIELTREFAVDLANRYQCAVDVAIHKPHGRGDERNFHAHLLATTRQITPSGLGEKTYIEWSDTNRTKAGLQPGRDEIVTVRARWAEFANRALERAHLYERVDHRSLEMQGIDREPTRHMGPAIAAIEARGERSHVMERMRVEEITARLERAAEIGRIARERIEAREWSIERTADIAAARQARETQHPEKDRSRTQEPNVPVKTEYDPEEGRRRARENWLAYREEKARQEERSRGREREVGIDRSDSLERAPPKDRGRELDGPDYGF